MLNPGWSLREVPPCSRHWHTSRAAAHQPSLPELIIRERTYSPQAISALVGQHAWIIRRADRSAPPRAASQPAGVFL